MSFEKVPHTFGVGEVLRNNNGSTYKVVKVQSLQSVLFQNTLTQKYVLAYKPAMYTETYGDCTREVLIWEQGEYYGDNPEVEAKFA